MRREHLLFAPLLAGAALAVALPLIAQPVTQNVLSGNECWNAGQGAGGPSVGFICAFQTRSSWGYVSNPAATAGTVQLPPNQNSVIFAAQPTGGGVTFNLPLSGAGVTDGQIVTFCNTTNAALVGVAVTVAAVAPATITAGSTTTLTTLAQHQCVKFFYTASNTTWSMIT